MSLPLSPRPKASVEHPCVTTYDHIRAMDRDDVDVAVDEDVAEAGDSKAPQQQPPAASALTNFYKFVGVRDNQDALDRAECAVLEWLPYSVRVYPDRKPRLLMGVVLWSIALTIFLALFITSYQTYISTSYLSLKDSQRCTAVTRTTSETFYADEQGHWSTQAEYQSVLTWYVLQLNNAHLTNEAYTRFVTKSLMYLQGNASKASNYTAAQTLMLLFTWRNTDIGAAANSTPSTMLYLAADPVTTFSFVPFNQFYVFNSTGYHGPFTSIDNIVGNRMQFRTYDTENIQTIAESTSTSSLGYYTIQVPFNLQSFFVAAAINRGLLSFGVLQSSSSSVRYGAMPSNFELYKDPRYPNMDPIYCDKSVQRCVLYIKPWGMDGSLEGAYYPLFETGSTDVQCVCPSAAVYTTESYCYYMYFHLGLAYLGQSSTLGTHPFKSSSWRSMGKDTASIVWKWMYYYNFESEYFYFTFHFDTWSDFNSVQINEFFTTILDPQCSSTKVVPYSTAITALEKTLPTDLSENYFECKYTSGESWSYALGIAAGQFHLYMLFAVLVVVYSFKGVFQFSYKPNFVVTYGLYRDYLERQGQKDEIKTDEGTAMAVC